MTVNFSNGDKFYFPNVPTKETPKAVVQQKDWVRDSKGNWVRG